MSWLVWRQYRIPAAVSAALLAAFAVLLVITGLSMADQFHAAFGACLAAHDCRWPVGDVSLGGGPAGFIVEFTLAVPAVFGMFLGAPLVAREAETGTSQFAWTQAVTRRHWLAVKTGWLLLAALAGGGAVGALVTWWSGPKNAAMALGIAAGTLIHRVLPALGVTLGGYFAVRLVIMGYLRQHYMTPVAATYSIGQDVSPTSGASWVLARGFGGPNGALPLPNGDNVSVVGNGFPVSDVPRACLPYLPPNAGRSQNQLLSCLTSHGYTQYISYQPAARYWPFQFIEAGLFVALATALIAVAFVVISRRDA